MKLSEDSILAHGKQSLISQFMQCFLSQLILNRKQKCKASGPKWHIWKLSNLDVLTHTAHFSSPGFKATEWPFLVAAPGFGWENQPDPTDPPSWPLSPLSLHMFQHTVALQKGRNTLRRGQRACRWLGSVRAMWGWWNSRAPPRPWAQASPRAPRGKQMDLQYCK